MSVTTHWQGYWEQPVWGRQPMRQLVLRFDGSDIEGEGVDVIGAFLFQGGIDDTGTVSLVKSYIGRHQVQYRGNYDGEGTIAGLWTIPGAMSGPFLLHRDHKQAANDPIATIDPVRQ